MASSSSMESYPLIFPLLLLVLPLLFRILKHKFAKVSNLPPGPKPWPIIGNLLNMGTKPHVVLAKLAQVHGPIISLRLGTQLVVVGSSQAAAIEILKTHDQELSGRCVPHVSFAKDPEMNKDSIAWTFECNDRWKFFRTLMRSELFSSKVVDAQSNIRERMASRMTNFLRRNEGKPVEIREVAFVYTFNSIANVYLTKDLIDFEGEESKKASGLIREMMELYTALNISDLYPILGGLDLQGLNRKTNDCVGRIRELWESIIKERREGKAGGDGDDSSRRKDFLDALLDGGFSDEQISFIFVELLAAVSDSSSSTVEWAMAELVKKPESMKRIREELAREIPNDDFIRESQLAKLPYLHLCVKEVLRLHPPAPLLLPHRATEDCEVMKYTIPKDTQVFVNVWAIARDPSNWDEPLAFKPERFLNSDLDYKGNHFEYLPFGGGRRICAGLPMAVRKVELAIASLVNNFDWSLPNNMCPNELDMNERYGVTLMKEQPLVLVPKRRT